MKSIDDVFEFVRDKYGHHKGAVLGTSRSRDVTMSRHIAMFLAIEKCGFSFSRTAKHFKRDHSTVVHAHNRIRKYILDGRIDLDDELIHYEPAIRHVIKVDESIDDALDLVRRRINSALQRDPFNTIRELISLAERLGDG